MKNKWEIISIASQIEHANATVVNANADTLTKQEVDELYAWLVSAPADLVKDKFNGVDSQFTMTVDIHRHTILAF